MNTPQASAPYPADEDHLADILSVAEATLPNGATRVVVKPATKFSQAYPGGWGYVISFEAEQTAIEAFVTSYTSMSAKSIDSYPETTWSTQLDDIELGDINRPWVTGLHTPPANTKLILERPLGRGWLLIRGASG